MATLATVGSAIARGAKTVMQNVTKAAGQVAQAVNGVPGELVPILELDRAEKARQGQVLKARAFHDGVQGAKIAKSLKDFLGFTDEEEKEFSLNFTATVTLAVAERLQLIGIGIAKEEKTVTPEGRDAIETWAARLWRAWRFEAKQADICEEALRDGEYFVMLDFDNDELRPRSFPHKRYTDPSVAYGDIVGDGEGMQMFYPNGDTNQKPLYAVKRYTKDKKKHVVIYYPDRVVTWRQDALGWVQPEKEVAWTHPTTGAPLGIPVVAFYTPGRKPEAKRVWIVQRLINASVVDVMQAVTASAFRVWLFFGWTPKDKDGNPFTITPGTWLGDGTKKPADASAQAVEGSNPSPMLENLDGMIFKMAALSDTPASRLMVTRQVAAEGTQKQQMEPLLAKCRRRQANFSSAYQDLFNIARRLSNAWGGTDLDEEVLLDALWEPLSPRNAQEDLAEANVELAKANVQVLKGQRGVSMAQSQKEFDYSDEDIARMKSEREEEQTSSADGFTRMFNAGR